LRIGVVAMVVLLGALAVRLTQLQGFNGSAYAREAALQRTQVINLPAVRGEIVDRTGATLAQDVDARAVYADPTLVDDPVAIAGKLATLVGLPAATITRKIVANPRAEFVYIARGLTPAVGAAVQKLDLRGVGVLDERRRVYPNGSLASNVIGYTRFGAEDLLEGNGGIEWAYDPLLRGQDGTERIQTDPAGRQIPSANDYVKAAVEGKNLRLTLDENLQWEAQSALADGVAQTGADAGTVVIMDPRTGNILAMADNPEFDPNDVGSANPAALGNRATGVAYEPGSVNKIITMAAALDRGLITPETAVTVPPDIRRGGSVIKDAEAHGTLPLTATGVLAHSSNIGAVLISEMVGSANLEATMRAFGLGRPTGLGFPGETGGQLAPSSRWSASQAATISYGQGMSATALQMATVYATIANGGVRMTPRLVDAIGAPGSPLVPTATAPGVRVVSTQTAHTLSDMLEQVTTTNGTAPAAAIPGYRVAGKTGTAYRVDPTCGCYRGYVASFIGFAPANNPRVVIAVVLDNPTKSYFGGTAAAPVFQKVMTFTLATLGVSPTSAPPPSLPLTQPGADAASGGLGQTDQLDQPAAAPLEPPPAVTEGAGAASPSPSARAPASPAASR
jgi:cell division protein FtsI (penicillin-binding protein 3)